MLRQTKTPTTASHVELRHRHQGWKQSGDERADEWNIIEGEGDHAPFEGEGQSGDPCERADENAGRRAHQCAHLHIFADFPAVAALPCRTIASAFGPGKSLGPAAQVIDFHQPR